MIWPFRKATKLSDAESFRLAAEQEPPTPCGKPVEHLTWKLNGVRCPLCAGIARREREVETEGRLAKMIAAEVATAMRPVEPTGDALCWIAAATRNSVGPSDSAQPVDYVLAGWRAALKQVPIQPPA